MDDDVVEYIWKYHRDLLTPAEVSADNRLMLLGAGEPPDPSAGLPPDALAFASRYAEKSRRQVEEILRRDPALNSPEVLALVEGGEAAFRRRVAERVLREHAGLALNRCPRCGGLCRTPKSKQCFRCGHSWRT
ncbi:MAG TPA: hypothetical protein VNK04_13855 [Gemmataceae bacterium]|nr:hypothetical protein [Gemmataceae bacterium]